MNGFERGTGGSVEKSTNFKKAWGRLLRYCKKYIPVIIATLILAAIGTLFQIIGPDKLKDIVDEIAKGLPALINGRSIVGAIDMSAIRNIVLLLTVLYTGSAILDFLQNFIMASVTQKISKTLRTDICKKINRLPLMYFDKVSQGDIMSRVTNDVDTIGQSMNQGVGTLVTSIAMFTGAIIMMFYNNWIMALTAITANLIGFVLMIVIMSKSQKYFVAQQQGLGDVNGHIEEIYSGHNVVKIYNYSKKGKKTFEAYNDNLYSSIWKSQFLSGMMMPIMNFAGSFGYVAVCVVGASLVLKGTISFGVVVAFIVYVRLFTQPLMQLAQAVQNMQRTAAASERIFNFFDETEITDESQKTKQFKNIKGNVEFKNIKFSYLPDKIIIHNFSAQIQAGQKVAIVGPTGAGKTTIINLLMRFYEPDSGEILIDKTPINEVTRENVHDQFCMVLQDTWLFDGSIKENIIYSKKNVTHKDVIEACKAVGLHHFINTFPNGYDTVLNEKTSLSQGQKQLVTIARAIIQNAPMLILDEATSSVDTRTEMLIQEAMDKLTVGRTSFVIAHRLSTIKNADIILVMKDGDIAESGNHTELLSRNGLYADLYNSQFTSNLA